MSKQKNIFKKTAAQIKAVKLLISSAIYVMLYGGSRSGKTAILVYSIIIRALKSPNSRHLILRRYFAHAKQSLWYDTIPKIAGLMGVTYKENKQDWFITLDNGAEIWIGGLDDKQRADKILGKEYVTIYFNESSEFTWDSIQVALTRLAQKCEQLVNKAYFDMNPPTKSHWSYKVFVQGVDPKTGNKLNNTALYAAMQLNPNDNKENIADGYIENILSNMNERQRKRFLDGEFVTDIEGALWTYDLIEKNRIDELPLIEKSCVAIDPAVSSKPDSDDTGIAVTGKTDDIGYVMEDATGKYTPLGWAEKAVSLYYKYDCDFIVAENNQGGDMVKAIIRQVDKDVPVKMVRAVKGKALRAEPIVGLYEQSRIKHFGDTLRELETEMTDWDATDPNAPSPNRIDAAVYGLSKLMLKKSSTFVSDNFIDI